MYIQKGRYPILQHLGQRTLCDIVKYPKSDYHTPLRNRGNDYGIMKAVFDGFSSVEMELNKHIYVVESCFNNAQWNPPYKSGQNVTPLYKQLKDNMSDNPQFGVLIDHKLMFFYNIVSPTEQYFILTDTKGIILRMSCSTHEKILTSPDIAAYTIYAGRWQDRFGKDSGDQHHDHFMNILVLKAHATCQTLILPKQSVRKDEYVKYYNMSDDDLTVLINVTDHPIFDIDNTEVKQSEIEDN